jgi:hypothetical protein
MAREISTLILDAYEERYECLERGTWFHHITVKCSQSYVGRLKSFPFFEDTAFRTVFSPGTYRYPARAEWGIYTETNRNVVKIKGFCEKRGSHGYYSDHQVAEQWIEFSSLEDRICESCGKIFAHPITDKYVCVAFKNRRMANIKNTRVLPKVIRWGGKVCRKCAVTQRRILKEIDEICLLKTKLQEVMCNGTDSRGN